jgi:hypothetical protein
MSFIPVNKQTNGRHFCLRQFRATCFLDGHRSAARALDVSTLYHNTPAAADDLFANQSRSIARFESAVPQIGEQSGPAARHGPQQQATGKQARPPSHHDRLVARRLHKCISGDSACSNAGDSQAKTEMGSNPRPRDLIVPASQLACLFPVFVAPPSTHERHRRAARQSTTIEPFALTPQSSIVAALATRAKP